MAQGLEALALVIGWLGVPVGYAALAMRVVEDRGWKLAFSPGNGSPLLLCPLASWLRLTVLELKGAYSSR